MKTIPILKTLRLGLILAAIWLLLSGHYNALMLAFGIVSILIVMWLSNRMDKTDGDDYSLKWSVSVVTYVFKLAYRIVESNIDVTARILGFRPTESQFVTLPLPFDDDFSNVLYANAITLTPGSASILMEGNTLLVHTISDASARGLEEGDMADIIPNGIPAKTNQESNS